MEDILTSGDKLVEECRRAFYAQAAPSVAPTLATSWSCPPYVGRGTNRVADRLAAKGRWLSHELTVFLTAPDDVINLVEDDKVLSNLVRLPLGHVGVPFDPGGN
ncbi:hypothetical protein V6N12_066201 [Hibiscus sabdariffa]|uniref:RNase H type-1 domain-containing protein n=1 Tax=Hibiscus sabdariffa TaxID=183260 RepID=A0ABR2B937_9ROSI